MGVFVFSRSTKRRSFPLGFLCANICLAYLPNGNLGMMTNFCTRASSTRMSSLGLIGAKSL